MPNAGKSTLTRAISDSQTKVADYPFTTLRPYLGVVRLEEYKSFTIADIPGLIEGASNGTGLGIQFLKHLTRTKVLLHLIDINPMESDPLCNARTIINELKDFDENLSKKECWLVLNKTDTLSEEEVKKRTDEIVNNLQFKSKVFQISALSKSGTKELCYELLSYLEID